MNDLAYVGNKNALKSTCYDVFLYFTKKIENIVNKIIVGSSNLYCFFLWEEKMKKKLKAILENLNNVIYEKEEVIALSLLRAISGEKYLG
jgi:hypothetical protein